MILYVGEGLIFRLVLDGSQVFRKSSESRFLKIFWDPTRFVFGAIDLEFFSPRLQSADSQTVHTSQFSKVVSTQHVSRVLLVQNLKYLLWEL